MCEIAISRFDRSCECDRHSEFVVWMGDNAISRLKEWSSRLLHVWHVGSSTRVTPKAQGCLMSMTIVNYANAMSPYFGGIFSKGYLCRITMLIYVQERAVAADTC